jgi:hypothetical protein
MRDRRQRSPKDMFLFGMVEDGPRGLPVFKEPIDEDVEDIASYGVDWDDIHNPRMIAHHNIHNNADIAGHHNPFITHQPECPTVVLVPEANCSSTLHWLDNQLEVLPYFLNGGMDSRHLLWVTALDMSWNV